MLISKVNKKKIVTNAVVLLVLLALIGFVVFKYILPKDEENAAPLGADSGINIDKLLGVKIVQPKKLEVEVFDADKYLLLRESGVKRTELKDLIKGKTELFPIQEK